MLTINLNERGYDCGMCGRYGQHRHAVSVDECGEPTTLETRHCKVVCKACHDRLHGNTVEALRAQVAAAREAVARQSPAKRAEMAGRFRVD